MALDYTSRLNFLERDHSPGSSIHPHAHGYTHAISSALVFYPRDNQPRFIPLGIGPGVGSANINIRHPTWQWVHTDPLRCTIGMCFYVHRGSQIPEWNVIDLDYVTLSSGGFTSVVTITIKARIGNELESYTYSIGAGVTAHQFDGSGISAFGGYDRTLEVEVRAIVRQEGGVTEFVRQITTFTLTSETTAFDSHDFYWEV